MKVLTKHLSQQKPVGETCQGFLAETTNMTEQSRTDVVRVIGDYIEAADNNLRECMKSASPLEKADKILRREVEGLHDDILQGVQQTDEERRYSLRYFYDSIKRIFLAFRTRAAKAKIAKINGEADSQSDIKPEPNDIATQDAEYDSSVLAVSVEIDKMLFGDVLEGIENGQLLSDDDNASLSPDDKFIISALTSDYLSEEEHDLKFLLAVQTFADNITPEIAKQGSLPLALGSAVKAYEFVSTQKCNAKMFQLQMIRAAVAKGEENAQ